MATVRPRLEQLEQRVPATTDPRAHRRPSVRACSGMIDKAEFREAMKELGLYHSDAVCDSAFNDYDFDDSGEIAYSEYIRYSLRDALARSLGRVMDLFKKWDTCGRSASNAGACCDLVPPRTRSSLAVGRDHSGTIDKKEFRASIRKMGFDAPKEDLDSLFDEVDADGGGSVDCTAARLELTQPQACRPHPRDFESHRCSQGAQQGTAHRRDDEARAGAAGGRARHHRDQAEE